MARCKLFRSSLQDISLGYGEAWTQRRGDSAGFAGGGVWGHGGGDLPQAWDQPAVVLPVEEEVCGPGIAAAHELRQLRDENAKLKRLVADLSLDRH